MKTATPRPGPIRAALLQWLGRPFGLHDTEAWANMRAASVSGVCVTHDNMLSLSAAWACTRLLSEVTSTLPLGIYERTASGKRPAPQHPLHALIHDQPNIDSTAATYWESVVAAMLLRGNARSEKLMLNGRLVGLLFLDPNRLSCTRKGDGTKEWRYAELDGTQRVIPADRIWNVPGFSLDGKEGASVIAYGARVFGSAIAADTASSKTFEQGMQPTTAWKFPKVLNPTQRADARAAIETLSGVMRAGKPTILEAGMDVVEIGIDPKDAQLLETRGFSVEEVCRWFRVPPFMIGHAEKSTSWGTGIEQQMIGFLVFTMAPWLRRIEQAITKDLLTGPDRARFYPKFNVEGLLRADSAGRASFYTVMVDHGIFTRDECRILEDRAPMGGNAAVLTVQSAMTTLDKIGTDTDANAVRNSLRALLGLQETPAEPSA